MNFRPKDYYQPHKPAPVEPKSVGSTINVYFRNEDGSLGQIVANGCEDHEEAILTVKEALVAEGDGLENKAVLAVLTGGKRNDC